MADQPQAVAVSSLRVQYGEFVALDGLDLNMPAGSVYAVLGPNGAGKTTLIKTLATLIRPTSGTVTVAGFDVESQAQEVRRRISLSGQHSAADADLTVAENLQLVGKLYGVKDPTARAEVLADDLALGDIFDRRVGGLSGGNQRRAALALSLVNQPEVLFLDEPTTGLDPRARLALWRVLEKLGAEGTSILLTTQYLEEADRLADQIIVINHGRVVEQGAPNELKRRIGGHLVRFSAIDSAALQQIQHLMDRNVTTHQEGLTPLSMIATLDEPGAVMSLISDVQRAGIGIDHIEIVTPTLDDVFLAVTGADTP